MKHGLLVVAIVVLAGCANPLSPGETDTTVTVDDPTTDISTTDEQTTDGATRTTTETQSATPAASGSITARVVEEAPANATVVSFRNETLQREQYSIVRSVVTDVIQSDSGFAQRDLYGEEVPDAVAAMQTFPYYESGGRAGIYVEKNGTVVEVRAYREDG